MVVITLCNLWSGLLSIDKGETVVNLVDHRALWLEVSVRVRVFVHRRFIFSSESFDLPQRRPSPINVPVALIVGKSGVKKFGAHVCGGRLSKGDRELLILAPNCLSPC